MFFFTGIASSPKVTGSINGSSKARSSASHNVPNAQQTQGSHSFAAALRNLAQQSVPGTNETTGTAQSPVTDPVKRDSGKLKIIHNQFLCKYENFSTYRKTS